MASSKKGDSRHKSSGETSVRSEDKNSILKWGENCNITKWKEFMIRTLDSEYGINASFTEKDAYEVYEFPELGAHADAHAKNMHTMLCGKIIDEQNKLINDRVSMWADILKHLSDTSLDKVKEDGDFITHRNNKKDVLGLWRIILKIHSAAQTGDPVQDRRVQREKIQAMKQGTNESLISFKRRLTEAYSIQKVLNDNVDPVSDEVKVQDFLSKLDIKYNEYCRRLNTDVALKVQKYPDSIQKCVEAIDKFQNVNKNELKSENSKRIETIFITDNNNKNYNYKKFTNNNKNNNNKKITNEEDENNTKQPTIKRTD